MKIIIMLITCMIFTATTYAGGDIEPLQKEFLNQKQAPLLIEEEEETEYKGEFTSRDNRGLYFGLGLGKSKSGNLSGMSSTLLLGYNFSQYIAIELRHNFLLEDAKRNDIVTTDEIKNTAIYFKQSIPLGTSVLPYALVGYGKTTYGSLSDRQIQWGGGLEYKFSEKLGFSINYESFHKGSFDKMISSDTKIESIQLMTSYTF